jgi:phosphoribosylanthranilate isomerase
MTWVKICGITNLEDGLTAVEAGADALGFVFYEKSPRYVNTATARSIVRELPAAIEKVGVFANQTEDSICALADEVGLTAVQLHGDNEDPRVADVIVERRPHLKVLVGVSMNCPNPERCATLWHADAVHAFLLDTGSATKYGGTGQSFDWEVGKPSVEAIAQLGRVVVAGGLNPGNVGEAVRIFWPWGVDVSSGVEAAPGKKDQHKVRAFVDAVRQIRDRKTKNRTEEKY